MQELRCFPEKFTQLTNILQARVSWRQISTCLHTVDISDACTLITLSLFYCAIPISQYILSMLVPDCLHLCINDVNLEQFTYQVLHCASVDTQGLPVLIGVKIPSGASNYFS